MKTIIILCIVVALAACSSEPEKPLYIDNGLDDSSIQRSDRQPNILFIIADDQSRKTVGAYGNKQIKTPNLDFLAQKGVNFSQAHNMGAWNGAVCQASRAMLNSGRSLWEAHRIDKVLGKDKYINTTWAKLLEAQGYDTYMTGKWHVSANAERVFGTSQHIRPGMPNDYWDHATMEGLFDAFYAGETTYASFEEFMPVGYNRPKSKNDNSWSPTDPAYGGFYEGGKHWSEVIKDDTLDFIERSKNSDKPFFMYVAFNAPHDPRQAPQAYQDMYDAEALEIPSNWQADYADKMAIGNGPSLRDAALAPFPRTQYATRVHLKEYYAIISHLDTQVGEILNALKNSTKMENTYIIYTADHGLAVGERGLFGKQTMYEESVIAPFIIWGPGIEGGQTIDADIYLQDAMATTLELAGVTKPDYVFFNSIIDLAKGKSKTSHYESIYGAYIDNQRMIKKDGFKLIVYPKANKVKLFDLNEDPLEMNDLAINGKHSQTISRLFSDLIALQDKVEDELDLSAMYAKFKTD
jgi:arylsulfatase A-like enzyme